MKNRRFLRSNNVILSLIFILLPLLVSFVMYSRVVASLQGYMEDQVTLQAAALGEQASQKLSVQLEELGQVAGYFRDGIVEEETMVSSIDRLLVDFSRVSSGILRLGGAALCGEDLPTSEYPAVRRAFRGYTTVRYREDSGLLFTVPVYNGGNIKYVLYEICNEKEFFTDFGTGCYDGQVQLMLADGSQQKAVPIRGAWEGKISLFGEEAFDGLKEKLNTNTSAAICYGSGKDKEFLFVSEIGEGNLYLIGRIPYAAVAGSISSLPYMISLVFGLLLVLLCIGTLNMFNASAKAKESDALREAKQAAEEANKTKGKFLANMSHELRTPVNVILGMDEMILRENVPENIREWAMDIKSASQILIGLINDVLDFSRIEAGNVTIIPVEYDLVAMIRDLVLLSENRARQKSLNFKMEIAPDLPVNLYGDDIHIRQVMINLLTNAVKYTEEGSVTLCISGERKGGDRIVLHCSVQDTGIGIQKEDLRRLFVPFTRVEEKRNRGIEGTGLGLSIIINLLRLMGSELKVESIYGEGSVFRFDLEQKVVSSEPIGDIHERLGNMARDYKYQVSFIAPEARILVVDDNSMNRRLFVSLLEQTQIQITTASSGKKALELVQEEHYDLIFMDHLMPEMDGVETLAALRVLENNLCKDTPVIALTANAFGSANEYYMKKGFDGFLSKPIVTEKLETLIREMLPEEYVSSAPVRAAGMMEEKAPAGEDTSDLPEIEGVNWKYAGLFLKSRKLLLTSVQHFYRDIDKTGSNIAELAESVDDEKGLGDYRLCVHTLKSTSASVGILSVSELARVLERAARNGDSGKVRLLTPALLEELDKIKENLRPFMEEREREAAEKDRPTADSERLRELFEMLRFSMERMDIGGTDICMNQIRSYSYEKELQEVVERVEHYITELDYEKAQEEIERFM